MRSVFAFSRFIRHLDLSYPFRVYTRLIDVLGPKHCLLDMLNTGSHIRGSETYSCASKARGNVCSGWGIHTLALVAEYRYPSAELKPDKGPDLYITPRL